jgi:hypothetical protein
MDIRGYGEWLYRDSHIPKLAKQAQDRRSSGSRAEALRRAREKAAARK